MTINKLDARLEAHYWPYTHRRMASVGLLKALLIDGEPLWTHVAKETWGDLIVASWLERYSGIQTPEDLATAQENSKGEFELGLAGMSLAYGVCGGYYPYDKTHRTAMFPRTKKAGTAGKPATPAVSSEI